MRTAGATVDTGTKPDLAPQRPLNTPSVSDLDLQIERPPENGRRTLEIGIPQQPLSRMERFEGCLIN
jgi:hypothetical protein